MAARTRAAARGALAAAAVLVAVLAAVGVPGVRAHLRRPPYLKNSVPEMWMSSPQLAKRHGYEMESHKVRTDDGYILTVHRVARGRYNSTVNPSPLLLGHGLCSCSEQWLVRGKDNLLFQLVELGFDVWLSNYRGNFYSKVHERLNDTTHDFWNFSWHENGVYDQAATIDYILARTGKKDLITVGHSMSSTAQLVLLADRPEYNAKVRANVLMAPPCFFNYPSGFIKLVQTLFWNIPGARNAYARELINDPFTGLTKPFPQSCYDNFGGTPGKKSKMLPHCERIFNFVLGELHEPVNLELLQLLIHHYPAGSSIRQVMHYAQCVHQDGKFVHYNFGPEKNKQMYGSTKPPPYNLTQITSPVYIHYSSGDGTVNYKDVETLTKGLLPEVVMRSRLIPTKRWCHIDYLVAEDANELLYKYVIEDVLKHKHE